MPRTISIGSVVQTISCERTLLDLRTALPLQQIAETTDGADRRTGAGYLAPYPVQEYFDGVGVDGAVVLVEALHQVLLRYHAPLAHHEDLEHFQLAGREFDRSSAEGDS